MIYTVTFNPALDYIVRLDSFTAGEINRVKYEQVLGGGKGINVSIVLKNLGHDSTALGFLAGFTGKEIIRQLEGFGCQSDFVELPEGFSRINVKVKAEPKPKSMVRDLELPQKLRQSFLPNWISFRPVILWFWPAVSPIRCQMISISVL